MTMLPRGRIKDVPEDFLVEELPAYEAQGTGDHLFVRFTKRNLTTDDAVRALAHAAGVQARDVGVAGLKDKVGVTTQTVSLPVPRASEGFDERVKGLTLPGITIHDARRHANKLKTGHLVGNRFTIVVRGLREDAVDGVVATFERVGREGIPNAFGSQRFGRDRDNAAQALAWLTGQGQGPRDPRKKRFLWSALQSALFNELLERRVADGTWRTPLLGDILKKTDSGGLFDCTDEATDQARAERGELSPTGPMFGAKMREPSGKPGELERAVFIERLGKDFDLARTKPFGEGTRRGLCLSIEGMTVARHTVERSMNRDAENSASFGEQEAGLTVCFVLPKGAYATSVLGAAVLFEPEMQTSPAHAPQTLEDADGSPERDAARPDTESDTE
jgi:tRNA pseudouridine13 synthase